jgi:hypothetical protein
LGLVVGNAILGRRAGIADYWIEHELTLCYLGEAAAVFKVRFRMGAGDKPCGQWANGGEVTGVDLCCRDWCKVLPVVSVKPNPAPKPPRKAKPGIKEQYERAILKALKSSKKALSGQEVLQAVKAALGDDCKATSIPGALTRAVKAELVVRTGRDMYTSAATPK